MSTTQDNFCPLTLYFKDHVITDLSKEGMSWYKMTPVDQEKSNDNTLSIFITGNDMIITGSFGDAIYTFDEQVEPSKLGNISIADFVDKCTSSPVGKLFLVWSPEVAKERFLVVLQDHFKERKQAFSLTSFLKQHELEADTFEEFFDSKIRLLGSIAYYLPRLNKQIALKDKANTWWVPDNRCYMQYLAVQSLAKHLSNN